MAGVLSLVADPTRRRLLYGLGVGVEFGVGDPAPALEVSQAAAGYALRPLRTDGLVARRQSGRTMSYRLADGFPEPVLDLWVRHLVALACVHDSTDGEYR